MSDTDDTDLLLLIPPDFFLVRSDLEDFDSESDADFGHREIKDAIVSDLITQVNDLESRICQIESLDRTSTRCSTCNDDSFINQSIISLTESDVLRAHLKEQRNIPRNEVGLGNKSYMVNLHNDESHSLDLTLDGENPIINSECNLVGNKSVKPKENIINTRPSHDAQVIDKPIFGNPETHFNSNCTRTSCDKEYLIPKNHPSKEKQTQLLNEVDSFLLSKQLNSAECGELSENSNNNKICIDGKESVDRALTINHTSVSSELLQSPENLEAKFSYEDHAQSLALTEVYKLISEMEETQAEMQKKLNVNQLPSHLHGKGNDTMEVSRDIRGLSQIYSSKVLELEDLSTKSPKTLLSKQPEHVLDKLKCERGQNSGSFDFSRPGKNFETNYSSTLPSTSTTNENSQQRISKQTLSPSRLSTGNYNPIDVVRANLPGRKDERSTHCSEGKDLPNKSTGFRRQLNFEKPLSPFRTSKSRMSSLMDQKTYHQNEFQNKFESDRQSVAPHQRAGRPGRTNLSLEEKFNSLSMQRASGTNDREDQNEQHNVVNKHSSESLQQKISSSNLLSLSELWNKEPTFYSDDPNKLRQKLEEERYRRQHCEQQIQALQVRVLEEQEKLAVAIRVDQEKDRAILQITESWKKLNDHWGELEEQRHNLAQQLQTERELSKTKNEELTKKVERWEKEVSQALDLAAGYKEKSEAVQKQMETVKRDTDEKMKDMENQLQNITEENRNLIEENKNLSEQFKSLQHRLKEEEDLLSKLKSELEKSRKRLSEFEAENTVLKEQKASLTTGIKEERNRISILEQKLNSLQEALNEASKKERAAAEEVRLSQERVEVARTELRALYQGQLEAVVKEKLQEFQAQLEAAEAALRAELAAKERQWADKAADQCRQLHDKYKRDLLRVEEIHKSEVNSWKEKLLESERLRAAVQKKLQEEADRRADIAQRLHSVMETQWREALNIISNPMKALYEVPKEDTPERWHHQRGQSPDRTQGQGDMKISRSASSTSLGPADEVPFSREGIVTYRTTQPATQDQQLKKYIQMLLERGPGNPVPPQNSSLQDSPEQQAFTQRSNATTHGNNDLFDKWIMDNEKKAAAQSDRQNQSNKPPWR